MNLFRKQILIKFIAAFSILLLGNVIFSTPENPCVEENCCGINAIEIQPEVHSCCAVEVPEAEPVHPKNSLEDNCDCIEKFVNVEEKLSLVKPNNEINIYPLVVNNFSGNDINLNVLENLGPQKRVILHQHSHLFILHSAFLN